MSKRDFFIEQARKVHGDKYDYSKVDYKRAHDKMCIICQKHGEFWQDKYTHLNGVGCPICAKENRPLKYTAEDFIEKCKKVWGNRYSYDNTVYNGIMNFVTITCPIHGDFEIRASDFLNGHGCQECGGVKRLTTEIFIDRAKKVHGDLYDYSKVKYVNNKTEVCIICPKHGEFWQKPVLHLKGHGCPNCFKNFKKTTEQFINEARQIHGDKYDYSKVAYSGNKKPITIICPKHGPWMATPISHLQGQGCQKCYDERRGEKTKLTQEEFLKRSRKVHGDKYDYSKAVYRRGADEVCIICPKHGEFWQRAEKHINGHGCQKCADELNGFNKRLTTEQFIEKARLVHSDKYDYSNVEYRTSNEYVSIICPEHGEFSQLAFIHLNGHGCPYCNESHLERDVNNILGKLGLLFIRQKRFDWLGNKSLDFYIPRYKLAIECQGLQHFNSVEHFGGNDEFDKRLKNDITKNVECEKNGVKILYTTINKNVVNCLNPIYNGIYNNNLYEINELENIIRNHSK